MSKAWPKLHLGLSLFLHTHLDIHIFLALQTTFQLLLVPCGFEQLLTSLYKRDTYPVTR